MSGHTTLDGLQGSALELYALCEICKAIFPIGEIWPWMLSSLEPENMGEGVLVRRSNFEQLRETLRAGCHLCNVPLEGLLPKKAIIGVPDNGSIYKKACEIWMQPDINGWALRVERDDTTDVRDYFVRQVSRIYATDQADETACNIELADQSGMKLMHATQTRSPTNFSPRAIRQMRDWLKDCEHKHKGCQHIAQERDPEHAFRLIDVGTDDASNVRLVSTSNTPVIPKYTILSHRWNSATKPTQLT